MNENAQKLEKFVSSTFVVKILKYFKLEQLKYIHKNI